jgi:hypothetical protein
LISSTTRGNKKVDRETDSRYVDRWRIHWKKTYRQQQQQQEIDRSTARRSIDSNNGSIASTATAARQIDRVDSNIDSSSSSK